MQELYRRKEVTEIKKTRKKNIIILLAVLFGALALFAVYMVTMTRVNKLYHAISAGVITGFLLCFDFAFYSFKIKPLNTELKFISRISGGNDSVVTVESFEVTDQTIVKNGIPFRTVKINGSEYLLDEDKLELLPEKVVKVGAVGRYLTMAEGSDDE